MRMPRILNSKILITTGITFFVAVIVLIVFIFQISRTPSTFPSYVIVTIPAGSSVTAAGNILAQKGIIKHPLVYRIYVTLLHDHLGIKAGQYLFDKPQSALRVAYRTAYGVQDLTKIRVTIQEGFDSEDIAKILGKSIPAFATTTFLTLARADEGYLYPDTYFFYQNTTPAQIISEMRSNFDDQLATIASSTKAFAVANRVTFDDIITMASIVEKEANSDTDRRIIAGILWKRIADKYPLQVDPPFAYFLEKSLSKLTLADLAIDSPYNLYKHKGLPPTPINNPSLEAIYATVNPTSSKYWYYLSDRQGMMHYAATYDQHLVNKQKWVD